MEKRGKGLVGWLVGGGEVKNESESGGGGGGGEQKKSVLKNGETIESFFACFASLASLEGKTT